MIRVLTWAFCLGMILIAPSAFAQDAQKGNKVSTENASLADAVECRPRDGLPNVLEKLKAGREVHIAYFGGSITAQDGWRVKTLAWFRKQFPSARVSEINAAIGGTGADLGAFRLQHDVLKYKPDLVFVEFAVNDGGTAPEQIYRSMEGIVRQIRKADPTIDICYVYTITQALAGPLMEGKFQRSASAMEKVADHYGIPSIHMAMEVAKLAKDSKLVWAGKKPSTDAEKEAMKDKFLFAPDSVHPYPETGHELYLQAVVRGMEKIASVGKAGPHSLPQPLMPDNWENAKMLPLDKARLSAGWHKLDMQKDDFGKRWAARMDQVWKADKPGETVEFRFKGTAASVYGLLGPDCGQVTVTLDDQKPSVRPLFDGYCSYHRLALLWAGSNLSDTVHRVKFEIHPDQPDKAEILKKGGKTKENPRDNPKKYDGRAWYAGCLMIVGELVE